MAISTRLRNKMQSYVGKKFRIYIKGNYMWTTKIIGFLDDTGYFETELDDGNHVWHSNASYGEVRIGIKKGIYRLI